METLEQMLIEGAEAVVEAEASRLERIKSRERRVRLALDHLGLSASTGRDWVTTGGDGFRFAALKQPEADRFLRALKELAHRLPPAPHAAVGPGQLELL